MGHSSTALMDEAGASETTPLLQPPFMDPFTAIFKQYVEKLNPTVAGDGVGGLQREESIDSEANVKTKESDADAAKKTRPKRGQYRYGRS